MDKLPPENLNKGIQALFNGDLFLGDPWYAPRLDWTVISSLEIIHTPLTDDEVKEILVNPSQKELTWHDVAHNSG